jgi:hypothetical protein
VGSTPTAPRPTIDQVIPLASEYYHREGNGVGGSLHIVLDDCNVGTDSVQYCRDYAVERDDWAGVVLADLLLQMTQRQRHKVCTRHRGYEDWPLVDETRFGPYSK